MGEDPGIFVQISRANLGWVLGQTSLLLSGQAWLGSSSFIGWLLRTEEAGCTAYGLCLFPASKCKWTHLKSTLSWQREVGPRWLLSWNYHRLHWSSAFLTGEFSSHPSWPLLPLSTGYLFESKCLLGPWHDQVFVGGNPSAEPTHARAFRAELLQLPLLFHCRCQVLCRTPQQASNRYWKPP